MKQNYLKGRISQQAAILLFGILTTTASVLAQGTVLPGTAKPHGYSLAEAAAATAEFNTGPRTPDTLDTLPRNFPFQVLYIPVEEPPRSTATFHVKPGTMLYMPVLNVDNSFPILGDFPDVTDPEAVADYYFSREQLGAESIEVEVDGNVTSLGPSYVVGAV